MPLVASASEQILYLLPLVFANFLAGAVIFSILTHWDGLRCNDQPPWWMNRSIKCDLLFVVFGPIFKIALRFIPSAVVFTALLFFMPIEEIYTYFMNGRGPLGALSPVVQAISFFIISDFLLYWSHRLFHGKIFWPVHAVHHSPQDVDWTTAYRFHPLNLALGPWLVTTVMIILGTSPRNILAIAPIEVAMTYFVHANLNITLGPLKFLVATPVFHRWHHTDASEGGGSNFGANFSFWDVLFGTFYFPHERLPAYYGLNASAIRESFLSQVVFPFKCWAYSILSTLRRVKRDHA